MIRPRVHLFSVERDVQPYDTRDGLLRLDMNEYLPYASKQLYAELKGRITPEVLSAYPMVNTAYSAISKLINQPINKLVLTNGADGVTLSVLTAFCDPGDLVGYVAPTYGMYQVYIQMLNLKPQCISYDAMRTINKEQILTCITPKMKVFLLANPNGIFGDDLDEDFVFQIIKKGHETGTIILLDEVYADFVDKGYSRYIKYTDTYDNLIIARSFSKSFGLAGVRAGYSISSSQTRNFLIAVRNNVEINSLAVEAIKVWCHYPDLLEASILEILDSKNNVCTELRKRGYYLTEGTANFILMHIEGVEHEKIRKSFEDRQIAVKYINWHDHAYCRVTVGTKEYMKSFLEATNISIGGGY